MRELFKNGYEANKIAMKKLDNDVLNYIKNSIREFRKQGKTFIRAGEIAKKFSVDSVQALGSLERLKPKLRKLNII